MYSIHITLKVQMAYNLSFIVKSEGVLKITGSHVHFKSGIVSKMVLDRDIVTSH